MKLLQEIVSFPASARQTLETEYGIESAEAFYAHAVQEPVGLAAGGVCPGFAGAVAAGLFVCDEGGGAFGAKNFAHAIITNIDNSEATSMRSSGRRPLFFCGSLTNVFRPYWSRVCKDKP